MRFLKKHWLWSNTCPADVFIPGEVPVACVDAGVGLATGQQVAGWEGAGVWAGVVEVCNGYPQPSVF